jgi:hypothetical protein
MKFTIRRNVRSFVSNSGMRLGARVVDILDKKIEKMLLTAVERARANERGTVLERDL